MSDQSLAVARELMAWRRSRTKRQPMSGIAAGDLSAAYATQEQLHELLAADGAGEMVGYKIALTSQAMQSMVGVDHPLAGALFASTVHQSPASFELEQFVHVGIECEMAVRLGEGLPVSGAPYGTDTVAPAVAACAPAYELVEDGYADYENLQATALIADNCWNAGTVVGEFFEAPADGWLGPSFTSAATRLHVDGKAAGEGRVGDAMGHPFEAVAWVANLLAERGRAIGRDMLIMTGSTIRTYFPNRGEVLRYEVEGMGRVDLSF